MIGTTLLHYAIDARLGEGGMGTVYRARDTVLNRTVAIKVLTATADAESTSRLLREARAASALNHPNSVTIHAVEQHGGVNFLVMEYVAGVPLDRAIPATGFPLDRALAYASGIAAAVAAAHAQGIVHRDLKPANVMVTPDDRVKVLDFGIARRTALAANEATQLSTVEGTLAGTGRADRHGGLHVAGAGPGPAGGRAVGRLRHRRHHLRAPHRDGALPPPDDVGVARGDGAPHAGAGRRRASRYSPGTHGDRVALPGKGSSAAAGIGG